MAGRWVLNPPPEAPPEREQSAPRGRWRLNDDPNAVTPLTAYGRNLADSVSLTLGDEFMGLGAGAGAALSGGDARQAYNEQVVRSREGLAEARRQQPLASFAGEATGYLVPGFGIGRVARTGVNLAGRLGRAAATGAAFGGVSGFGSGENMQERLQYGLTGVGLGAATGAGLHGVLGELAPSAFRAGRRALGLPSVSGPQGLAERSRDDLLALARRNDELNVRDFNDLGRVVDDAVQRDPSITLAEALGRPAINRTIKYTRLPGKSAQIAERTLTERNADTFDQLVGRLDDTITPLDKNGAPLGFRNAEGELDAAFDRASVRGYEQAFKNRMSPDHVGRMQNIVGQHPELYDRALNEARILMRGDNVASGGPNDPRFWHYVKVAAGDTIRTMRREGLGQTRARQYTHSLKRLVNDLDQVPGYRAARQQWGSLSEAREALESGFAFDRLAPSAMEDLAQTLTPFQRRYLRAGIAERVRDVLERRDNLGFNNIARELTGRRRSRLMQLAFDDGAMPTPRQPLITKGGREAQLNRRSSIYRNFAASNGGKTAIDDFLQYAATRRQMHADASRMVSSNNSVTGIVGDDMFSALPAGLGGVRTGLMNAAYDRTIGKLAEEHRNFLGRILLTPVDEFKRRSLGGRLLTRARREQARRLRLERTKGAYVAGVGGMGIYDPHREQQ